jgi:DNA repair exonuclease SbcCD nuclease subunit
MRKLFLIWFLIVFSMTAIIFMRQKNISKYAPSGYPADQIVQSIILAGDGGSMVPDVAKFLKDQASILPDRLTVIFLGDNIYPAGLPAENTPEYAVALNKLKFQINNVKGSGAKILFIPGNHDWEDLDSTIGDGWERVKREQKKVEELLGKDSFFPKNGCPGPDLVSIPPSFSLIALDSEWWFYNFEKPGEKNSECASKNENEVLQNLTKTIDAKEKDKTLILAMHHPLVSYGHHRFSDASQSMLSARYQEYLKKMHALLNDHPVDICAAGHEHSLQVLGPATGCNRSIVSGALTDTSDIKLGNITLFAAKELGFVRLDRFKDGKIRVEVLSPAQEKRTETELYRRWLN